MRRRGVRPGRAAQAPSTIEIEGEAANDRGTSSATGSEQIAVEAGSFYFSPTLITGPPGQQIELAVTAAGDGGTHNISLPEQSIDQDLTPTAGASLQVTMPTSGTVVFFCSFHRDRGMLGGLTAA